MREDGWYWILVETWLVAEWRASKWWTCGSERPWTAGDGLEEIKQIGERITRDGK